MFIVEGFMYSRGRAKALISHVPPESILQGAEVFMGLWSRSLLILGIDHQAFI